jgi:hypothetical protein
MKTKTPTDGLQPGYDPDILVEKTSPSTPNATTAGADPEAAIRVQTPVQRQESGSLTIVTKEKKRPFQVYTTKKGFIVIAIAALVIITVAVVGGVLGSRKSNNNNGASLQENGSYTASATSSGQLTGSTVTYPLYHPVYPTQATQVPR